MSNLLTSMFEPWARMVETGLTLMGSTLQAVQSSIEKLADQAPPTPATEPPLDGPADVDAATADFANRLAHILVRTPVTPGALLAAWTEVVDSVLKSFGRIDLRYPQQWMVLPIQLPLSFGTLLAQSGLRGLHGASVVGLSDTPDLFSYVTEVFTDFGISTTLQYKEYLARLREEVRRSPDDAGARLQLGRTYIKLGRYTEAIQELASAAGRPAVRAAALRESAVANFRAGDFQQAVKDGSASLALAPADDRTRFWLWLAARKLGGYPADVPEDLRMEMKVGYDAPAVEFEDVADKIGLDKISGGRGTAVFDLDGDGCLDVVICGAHAGCGVYRNNGDGTFTDVSVGSGLEDRVNTFCVAVGDYNNDGRDDLYITRFGFFPGDSLLYRNNGDGTFTDVTREAGVANWGPPLPPSGRTTTATATWICSWPTIWAGCSTD